jgi:signal transduction histidine kinase
MFDALRRRFVTIGWKLTASYVLVSLLLTTIVIVVSLTVLWFFLSSNLTPQLFAFTNTEYGALMQPEFEAEPLDPQRLGLRLQLLNGDLTGDPQTVTADGSVELDTRYVLLDSTGRVITSTLPTEYTPGALLANTEPPEARPLLENALRGVTDTLQLATFSAPDRHILTAAPILNEQNRVLGVLYQRVDNFPSTSILGAIAPTLFLLGLAPQFVVSSLIGLLFGWLVGRGFSKRLKRLTEASAALAGGDLSRRITDCSVDEIGQLGSQFNRMADQLATNVRDLRLLADRNAQLAEQAAQLAIIEERNRLARDLHDSVSQDLFSLTMLAAATRRMIVDRPDLAADQLQEMQETAQRALQETRSLVLALRPAALDGRGLAPALRDLAAAVHARQGLDVALTISGERRLPFEYEQALFRIVQEALGNVARHSGVRAAEVTLCYADHSVSLTVTDRGRGFDTNAARNLRALGLDTMAERARELGGSFHVQSAANQGTTVAVSLPAPPLAI